eukprot:gene42455-56419_t
MDQSRPSSLNYSFPVLTFLNEMLFSKNDKEKSIAKRLALRNREKALQSNQEMAIHRHRDLIEKTNIWNESIFPYWDDYSKYRDGLTSSDKMSRESTAFDNKVKELCSRGIPSNIRGKVWPLLIGNELM